MCFIYYSIPNWVVHSATISLWSLQLQSGVLTPFYGGCLTDIHDNWLYHLEKGIHNTIIINHVLVVWAFIQLYAN